ncbi:hypothetical protein Golax_005313 [Gossypium laxum]|uniref:Uncharacterized protein n=1 Tax=Gossypium laxum TaxID=34288 RepID=A0A7J9A1S2_9ROSI|nr:hypothetical protein [Gossypium laxum]
MEDELADLHLEDAKEKAFRGDLKDSTDDLQFCLMGYC